MERRKRIWGRNPDSDTSARISRSATHAPRRAMCWRTVSHTSRISGDTSCVFKHRSASASICRTRSRVILYSRPIASNVFGRPPRSPNRFSTISLIRREGRDFRSDLVASTGECAKDKAGISTRSRSCSPLEVPGMPHHKQGACDKNR